MERIWGTGVAQVELQYYLKVEIPLGPLLFPFLAFVSFFPSVGGKRSTWCIFFLSCLLNSHQSQIVLSSLFGGADKRTAKVKTQFQEKHKVYIHDYGYGLKKNFVADNDREGVIGEELVREREET